MARSTFSEILKYTVSPTDAGGIIGIISVLALIFRSPNAAGSLNSPTSEIVASEISACTVYCSVSPPHCQSDSAITITKRCPLKDQVNLPDTPETGLGIMNEMNLLKE